MVTGLTLVVLGSLFFVNVAFNKVWVVVLTENVVKVFAFVG